MHFTFLKDFKLFLLVKNLSENQDFENNFYKLCKWKTIIDIVCSLGWLSETERSKMKASHIMFKHVVQKHLLFILIQGVQKPLKKLYLS